MVPVLTDGTYIFNTLYRGTDSTGVFIGSRNYMNISDNRIPYSIAVLDENIVLDSVLVVLAKFNNFLEDVSITNQKMVEKVHLLHVLA